MPQGLLGNVPLNPSPQGQTVLKWAEYFSQKNIDGLASVMSENWTQKLMPKSLDIGDRLFTKPQSLLIVETVLRSIKSDITGTVHEWIEKGDLVVAHITFDGTSATDGPYNGDFMFWFQVKEEEDGKFRIVSLGEFLDSKFVAAYIEREKIIIPVF
ncbi:hypothetical protein C8Q75DRAFT_222690 [Abortiporus biennis]|nr:hypothetical protein C8Q75DRAFT_222690 [Abortiporus biennis]